jgi:predicted transcriptional regulator YdeE/uncharacterized protein YndB with AHSA1/START domain
MFSIPFHLDRSVVIDRSPAEVYAAVSDFATWPRWSPWLCQEPDCPVDITGEVGTAGHGQAWDGDLIGAGNMQISEAVQDARLDYDLLFLKPWKTRSKVGFSFAPEGDGTRVTWWMQGSLPFFMFFIKKITMTMVGGDYVRGLNMLKEYLETGEVPSGVDVRTAAERGAFHYVGRRRSCKFADIGPTMEEDLTALGRLKDEGALPAPERILSLYHKWDLVGGTCEYTTAFAYASAQAAPAGLDAGTLPAHRALQVAHRGAYRHLGNAWAAAMGCARSKYKLNKGLPMYEVYLDSPHEVDEAELEVELHIPVK